MIYYNETKSQPIFIIGNGHNRSYVCSQRFMGKKSRMKGDFHVRFRGNLGVQFPGVTRLPAIEKNILESLELKHQCDYFVITKTTRMDISVIHIGNSRGIRLSKTLLEKYNITDKVELILEKGYIILKPKREPRSGWEKAFKRMHENGDDKLLINDFFEDENLEEWN